MYWMIKNKKKKEAKTKVHQKRFCWIFAFFFFQEGDMRWTKTFLLPFQDFGFEMEEQLAETELSAKIRSPHFFHHRKNLNELLVSFLCATPNPRGLRTYSCSKQKKKSCWKKLEFICTFVRILLCSLHQKAFFSVSEALFGLLFFFLVVWLTFRK